MRTALAQVVAASGGRRSTTSCRSEGTSAGPTSPGSVSTHTEAHPGAKTACQVHAGLAVVAASAARPSTTCCPAQPACLAPASQAAHAAGGARERGRLPARHARGWRRWWQRRLPGPAPAAAPARAPPRPSSGCRPPGPCPCTPTALVSKVASLGRYGCQPTCAHKEHGCIQADEEHAHWGLCEVSTICLSAAGRAHLKACWCCSSGAGTACWAEAGRGPRLLAVLLRLPTASAQAAGGPSATTSAQRGPASQAAARPADTVWS